MIVNIVEFFAYTGCIAAMLAISLALFTFLFLGTTINYYLLALIFSGTITIYNIDHLRGLAYDTATNSRRVYFIKSNKVLIYLITGISILASIISIFFISFNIIPILLVPFVLGLLHRRIKENPIVAAAYITISWLIVTVCLPAYLVNGLDRVISLILILGTLLFCNAYTSSARQKFYAFKHAGYLFYLSIIVIISLLALRGEYLGLIPVAFFTAVALLNFRNDEDYETIYLDGIQLSGMILSILFFKLITI